MTPEAIEKYKQSMAQIDAIWALEGFEPTEVDKIIDEAVMAGRITNGEVIAELSAYAKEHKSIKGFIESRAWTR